ncbi:MAG: hypothetical protein Q7J76_12655 [Candidatus Brocadiaceae bacterium]|nr:hypothetical protein [Candidatus Brocadiaceae bacterium]
MTGHSSLGMLQKYSHTGLDNKKRAIQALTDHVLTTSKKANLAIAQEKRYGVSTARQRLINYMILLFKHLENTCNLKVINYNCKN